MTLILADGDGLRISENPSHPCHLRFYQHKNWHDSSTQILQLAAKSARRADETKFVGVNPDKNWSKNTNFFVTASQKFCHCKIWVQE